MCVVGYFDQSIIEDENQAMGRVRTALENRDGDVRGQGNGNGGLYGNIGKRGAWSFYTLDILHDSTYDFAGNIRKLKNVEHDVHREALAQTKREIRIASNHPQHDQLGAIVGEVA